ncbi:MAG: hypothetical protein KDC43_16140 [Saprospiraceae bacterium]|nr:hypothetical protein [Saprospiraceae bacterium]
MLGELELLLESTPADADYVAYETTVLDENVLMKGTDSTRRRTLRGLRELYGLQRDVILFSALRDLWEDNAESRPVLAMLSACARDPLLRASGSVILEAQVGDDVLSAELAAAVKDAFPGRYNPNTLAKIGRNAASSWQQSGHLKGRISKTRVQVKPTSASTAYALLLGHLCGQRGEALFETLWARLLDVPVHTLHELALQASRQGWIDYRHTGAVTEITFHYLLRDNDNQERAT